LAERLNAQFQDVQGRVMVSVENAPKGFPNPLTDLVQVFTQLRQVEALGER
jgi:hypothetical protein